MLKIIFLLLVPAYIIPILRTLISLRRIKTGLRRLAEFAAVYGSSAPYFRPKKETYATELNALLRYYPVISGFVSYPKLSYSLADEALYRNSCQIISDLQMKLNETRHLLIRSFNPLFSIQELALLPVRVLQEIGFRPGKTGSVILNITGWTISYLLGMFEPEIKSLLILLFEKLVGA